MSGTSLRIMALGDSITEGYGSSDKNGYRLTLRTKLQQAGAEVEYIGGIHHGTMDNNAHEGYGGLNIRQIYEQGGVNDTLRQKPNLVLLHAGTNDINDYTPKEPWSEAPSRLGLLIDNVLNLCPETVLIVAQIISCPWDGAVDRMPEYNAGVLNVVSQRASRGYKVTSVDMHAIGVGAQDLIDNLHPNDRGYKRMANFWYETIYKVHEQGWIDPPSSKPSSFDT